MFNRVKGLSSFGQLARYLLIGVINLLVCLSIMRIGSLLGLTYLYYTFLGYAFAMVNSYLLNGFFTFSKGTFSFQQFFWFIVVNGLNLCSVEGLEYTLIEHIGLFEIPTIFFGMVWYTLIGFFMNRRFVFYKECSVHEN